MNKLLTMQDIKSKHGDYKTIFAVETGTERRFVHILGYAYYTDDGTETPYRLLEYTFFYATLDEVLQRGLSTIEHEDSENFKQYVTDVCEDKILYIYNNYDNGNKPAQLLKELTKDTPDGIYILEND